MSDFNAPWAWDDSVWEECDQMQRAPWLVDAVGNPVLKGEIRCVSEEFAHLIAAAPELLNALNELRNRVNLYFGPSEVGEAWPTFFDTSMRLADSAISKAAGE